MGPFESGGGFDNNDFFEVTRGMEEEEEGDNGRRVEFGSPLKVVISCRYVV